MNELLLLVDSQEQATNSSTLIVTWFGSQLLFI